MQLENIYKKCSILLVLLLVLLYTFPQVIETRELWYSDEVRHASTYQEMLDSENYFTLSLNGERYTDKPPLYYWFLGLIQEITSLEGEKVFFVGVMLSILVFVFSTYFLAFVTGMNNSIIVSACCMSLTTILTFALTQFSRMDMLFAGTINISFCLFYISLLKKNNFIPLFTAFFCMGIACLIKGPFALVFPVIGSLTYLIWSKKSSLFFSKTMLKGSLGFFLVIFAWLGSLYFSGQLDYLIETFKLQIAGRAVNSWRHAAPWYYYFMYMPLLLLPFSFILLLGNKKSKLSIIKGNLLFSRQNLQNYLERKSDEEKESLLEKSGTVWLYTIFFASLVLLTIVSAKLAIYSLPLFPAGLILLSKKMMSFGEKSKKYFVNLLVVQFFILGLVFSLVMLGKPLAALSFIQEISIPEDILSMILTLSSDYKVFLIALLFFLSAYIVKRLSRVVTIEKVLLFYTFSLGICVWAVSFIAIPHISPYFSTKEIGSEMSLYIEKGYLPISYRIYSGTFTYYAKHNLIEVDTPKELNSQLKDKNKAVIVIREKYYNLLTKEKNQYITQAKILDRQFISSREYILLEYRKDSN